MKKQYMQPNTTILAVTIQQMVCASKTVPVGDGNVSDVNDLCSRRRRRNDWDDEDDWEDEEDY